jgi:SAM-dependent methyltransferase
MPATRRSRRQNDEATRLEMPFTPDESFADPGRRAKIDDKHMTRDGRQSKIIERVDNLRDIDPLPALLPARPHYMLGWNIEIQRHDIVADPLPAQTFDLIHARLVLFHVSAREQALERMVAALKPGGWIVIEDFDRNFMDFSYPSTDAEGAALYQKMQAALGQLMEARGVDPIWGRSLYRRLRAHGLVNVGMEGYVAVREGRSPGPRLARANFEQIRQEATDAGLITDEEVTRMLTLLDDPDFAFGSHIMFSAWGRQPQP